MDAVAAAMPSTYLPLSTRRAPHTRRSPSPPLGCPFFAPKLRRALRAQDDGHVPVDDLLVLVVLEQLVVLAAACDGKITSPTEHDQEIAVWRSWRGQARKDISAFFRDSR